MSSKNYFIVLVCFLVNCSGSQEELKPKPVEKPVLKVMVLGQQFEWMFRYPGADGKLGKFNYKCISEANPTGIDTTDADANDDFAIRDTLVLPSDSVEFYIHAKDVIHSMYLPHFRTQMNAVPGMQTVVKLSKLKTTVDIRHEMKKEDFHYLILCNKICGASHYQMHKPVVVRKREEFDAWFKERSVKK